MLATVYERQSEVTKLHSLLQIEARYKFAYNCYP